MKEPLAGEGTILALSAGAWTTLYEDLLAGIIHSMNNTITVLGVSLELAAPGDASREHASLRREIGHLERLIALTATLSNRSLRQEALEVRAVMDLALTIHALNPATRSVKCALQMTGEIPPVRVPRAALMRLFLMIIDGAKRAEHDDSGPVQIDVAGDPEHVVIRAPFHSTSTSDVAGFAEACGAAMTVGNGTIMLELPSLQQLRRAGNVPRSM